MSEPAIVEGLIVRYWKGARRGEPSGTSTVTSVGDIGGIRVVWLEGVSGCIAHTHIQAVPVSLCAKEIMESMSDEEYLRKAVTYAGVNSYDRRPRWSHVGRITTNGCGVSSELCIRFGLDPDEIVGREVADCELCPTCGTEIT